MQLFKRKQTPKPEKALTLYIGDIIHRAIQLRTASLVKNSALKQQMISEACHELLQVIHELRREHG